MINKIDFNSHMVQRTVAHIMAIVGPDRPVVIVAPDRGIVGPNRIRIVGPKRNRVRRPDRIKLLARIDQ